MLCCRKRWERRLVEPEAMSPKEGGALTSLQGFEVFAQVSDPLADRRFVVLFLILEDRTPYGHLGRAVRRKAETETEYGDYVIPGELTPIPFRERGEV